MNDKAAIVEYIGGTNTSHRSKRVKVWNLLALIINKQRELTSSQHESN